MVQADINITTQVYLPTPLYYIWNLTNQSKHIEGISDNLCDGPGRHKHDNPSIPTYTTVSYMGLDQSKQIHRRNI